jgi:hypothetical protein
MLLMLSCPIGIDWSVTHVSGTVRLSHVVRYDTLDEAEAVRFPEIAVELAEHEYRAQVVAFAAKARELFEGIEKVFGDDLDRRDYEAFWKEYEERLGRAAAWRRRLGGAVQGLYRRAGRYRPTP